jgi:hypothetical protein
MRPWIFGEDTGTFEDYAAKMPTLNKFVIHLGNGQLANSVPAMSTNYGKYPESGGNPPVAVM